MPFHVVPTDNGFNVENAVTKEVKNQAPYRSKAKAEAYSRSLNANTVGEGKSGAMINSSNRGRIRTIRAAANSIVDHTMALVPNEEDNPDEMEPDADIDEVGGMDANDAHAAIDRLVQKAISKREDVNPKEGTNKYGNVSFADEKNKKYPIDTVEHIRAAWNYINKEGNSGKYSSDEIATIKRKIVAAWKDKIDKEGPPSAKSINLIYAKSLGIAMLPDLAAKYIGRDEIRGYMNLWGDPDLIDVEAEYFTRDTNFWDDTLGQSPRPLTWDHAQDKSMRADPRIGTINEFGDDDIGRWYVAKLERSHLYRKAIDALIDERVLGTSSDSAPQYVERVRTGKSTWLKTWPWFAGALTEAPAEPRMIDTVEYFKSLGITLPDIPQSEKTEWDEAQAIFALTKAKYYAQGA